MGLCLDRGPRRLEGKICSRTYLEPAKCRTISQINRRRRNRTSFVDLPRFFRTMVTLRRLPRLAAFVPEGRLSNGPGCGGHAFKRNRQEECVQMPVKIARSAPRPSFGLPELLVAIHTSRQSCCKAAKARIFTPVRESSGESRLKIGRFSYSVIPGD